MRSVRARRIVLLLLLLLLALPGFPPLLSFGLQQVVSMLGVSAHWRSVSGYALIGVSLSDVQLKMPGLELKAKRLNIGYNLLGLLGHTLPLSIGLEDASLKVQPSLLSTGGGGSSPIRPLLTSMRLHNVKVLLAGSKVSMLPTVSLSLSGNGAKLLVYGRAARWTGDRCCEPERSEWRHSQATG